MVFPFILGHLTRLPSEGASFCQPCLASCSSQHTQLPFVLGHKPWPGNSIWAFWIHEVGSEALNQQFLFPVLFLRVMKRQRSFERHGHVGSLFLQESSYFLQMVFKSKSKYSSQIVFDILPGQCDLCVQMPQTPSHTLRPVPFPRWVPLFHFPHFQVSCFSPSSTHADMDGGPFSFIFSKHCLQVLQLSGDSEGTGSSGGMGGELGKWWQHTAQNSCPAS